MQFMRQLEDLLLVPIDEAIDEVDEVGLLEDVRDVEYISYLRLELLTFLDDVVEDVEYFLQLNLLPFKGKVRSNLISQQEKSL